MIEVNKEISEANKNSDKKNLDKNGLALTCTICKLEKNQKSEKIEFKHQILDEKEIQNIKFAKKNKPNKIFYNNKKLFNCNRAENKKKINNIILSDQYSKKLKKQKKIDRKKFKTSNLVIENIKNIDLASESLDNFQKVGLKNKEILEKEILNTEKKSLNVTDGSNLSNEDMHEYNLIRLKTKKNENKNLKII
ncbi:hypothetical protein GVAV_001765 [Gurleya vavrai]